MCIRANGKRIVDGQGAAWSSFKEICHLAKLLEERSRGRLQSCSVQPDSMKVVHEMKEMAAQMVKDMNNLAARIQAIQTDQAAEPSSAPE